MDLEKTGKRGVSRRGFLRGAAATAAGVAGSKYIGGPYILRAAELNKQKLNVLFVATGGRAGAHVNDLAGTESPLRQNVLAYADVDPGRTGEIKKFAPNAAAYTDWRRMYDRHLKDADVVVVATPDHSHAVASLRAIEAGKHVYTEKPLTWSIHEARVLAEATARRKVATQMGNQGHANEGNRLVVEWVRGGVIGDITEVHTWTNRPVWPQGNVPRTPKPIPAGLDWEAWIGPAPYREFHENLHDFKWRGWKDFGCGAIGDMGAHTWDSVFWSLAPDYPSTTTLLDIEERNAETFPKRSHFVWEFPAKGNRRAFVSHWYSGGWKPPVPEEILNDPTKQGKDDKGNPKKPDLPETGSLYIGTKGKLLVAGDYGNSPRLIPEAFMREAKLPEKTIPRSPGHMQEFIMAAKGEKPWDYPGSNFANYAGPLTEVMLVGAIAEKIGEKGFKIECDAPGRKVLTKEAQPHLTREYRKGWELQG